MTEQLQPNTDYCEVYGNTGIETPFGSLSVDIQAASLKGELVNTTNNYYVNNPKARETGEERAGRLVCAFGGIPLTEVLLPRFDRILTANGVLKANKDQVLKEWGQKFAGYDRVTASSFINPLDDKEYIFYFNLPLLVKARGLNSSADFAENFRQTWVHERHHFAQYADTKSFAERMAKENGSMETIMLLYMLGIPVTSGVAGLKAAGKIIETLEEAKNIRMSRRGLLKGVGGLFGLAVGAEVVANTYNEVGYNLQYNVLPTFEHEAVDAAKNTKYTTSDLQQTFQFSYR